MTVSEQLFQPGYGCCLTTKFGDSLIGCSLQAACCKEVTASEFSTKSPKVQQYFDQTEVSSVVSVLIETAVTSRSNHVLNIQVFPLQSRCSIKLASKCQILGGYLMFENVSN
jgi:hypothetical protein